MRPRTIVAITLMLWVGLEHRASAQCDELNPNCLGPSEVHWNQGVISDIPQGSYHGRSGAFEFGTWVAQSTQSSITLTPETCDGTDLGAEIAAFNAMAHETPDLLAHATCNGTEPEAALLHDVVGTVQVPSAQGPPQTVNADGSGGSGDHTTTDPVDPVTGEFVHEQIDLEFPSFGVPFRLRRLYRSRIDFTGPLGPGWDHVYNQRLVNAPRVAIGEADPLPGGPTDLGTATVAVPVVSVSSCGPTLLLSNGEGTSVQFNEIADSAGVHSYWSSAALLTLKGTDGPDGTTWTLQAPDGTLRYFDSRGLLVRWVDANDIGLTLAWSGEGATARLESVTDSADREIQFEYYPSNLLRRVYASGSALEASYTYDENGGLKTAHRGDGHGERYEYDFDATRADATWLADPQLRASCAAACARTDQTTCSTGGACDEPVAMATENCQSWVESGECAGDCHAACWSECTAGPGAENDQRPCDALCEHDSSQEAILYDECDRVWNDEGAKTTCNTCDDDCEQIATAQCEALFYGMNLGDDDDVWQAWLDSCKASLTSCCADASGCDTDSCHDLHPCEEICKEAFFGDAEIETTCTKPCSDWDEHSGLPPPPECPLATPRFGCMRAATDDCKDQCAEHCHKAECEPQCKTGCSLDTCLAMDFEGTCNDTCTESCVEAGRAPGSDGGPRYGRPRDLNFNLRRIYDGAERLYLENEYGTVLWSPEYDTVVSQQFGEYAPQLAHWDLIGGAGGPVTLFPPAWAGMLIEGANEFEPVEICPYNCASQQGAPWDEAVVPFSVGLSMVFVPGTVTSPVTGFAVNKVLTQQVGPTLVTFSTNAQGVLVGAISRRTSTTNYFATTAVSLPITLNDGETVTLATSRTGAVTITGTAAGKAQLASMGTMTLFTDSAKQVQAYAGSPVELLKATSGSCTAPFTLERISTTEVRLSPSTACTGELWVTPVGGRYPDQTAADQFATQGLSALSTSAFHASTLAPTRDGAIWRQGIDGRRVREKPPTGAGLIDAGNTATSQYTATPMFSAPTATSGLGEPLYVFQHVPADYKISNPPPPPSDDPWSGADLPMQDAPITCSPSGPGGAVRGSGVRPTQVTAVIDFHGARWTIYADEHNNILRRINHETGAVWSFNYDPIGQLTGIEYPDRARTCLARDLLGNVIRREDIAADVSGIPTPDPVVQNAIYNKTNSAITQIFDPRTSGASLAIIARDPVGNPLSVQEAGGVTTASFAFVGGAGSDRLQIASVTQPGNAITAMTYDNGTIASITVDPAGANLHRDLIPDPDGRLTLRTNELGLEESWTYDGDGPLLATAQWTGDGHSAQRRFEYDQDGQVTAMNVGVADAERLRTELTYDVTGSLVRTKQIATDGSATTAVTCQDVAPGERVMETVSAEGIRTRYTRDGEGHVTQIVVGDLGPSPRAWDDGCLDHPTGGTGTFTMATYSYDIAGHLVSSTDERGLLTTIKRDGFGRPIMITRPDGTQVRRGYDALGNIIWDAIYTTTNLPDYRPPSWSDGGLHAATQYFYDARDRLFEIWRWQFTGAQVATGDGYSVTHFDFDDVAHTITRTDDGGFQWLSRFDAAGRLVEERAPDGTARTYAYPNPRTARITEPAPSGTITYEKSLTAWGAIASEGPRIGTTTYPIATTQFDELLRPISSTSHTGENVGVSYDAFGRATQQVHTVPGSASETVTIGYDRDGRPLTRTSIADSATTGAWTWQYDALGREIDAADPGGGHTSTTYVLGSQLPNVVTDPRGVQFQHTWSTNSNALFLNAVDPGGPDTSLTYVWDERGNLVSASRTDEGGAAVTNTFQYDSIDDRTQETDNQLGSAWTRTAQFDGRGLPTKTWLNGKTISRTFDLLGRLSTVTWGSESTPLASYSYSGFDFRTSRALQNNLTTSYAYDALGRLTDLVDAKVTTTPPTTIASFKWQVPLDGVPRRQDFHRGVVSENSAFTVDAALRTIDEDNASNASFGLTPTTSWTGANGLAAATLGAQNWKYTLDGRSAWKRRVRGTSGTTDYLRDARDALTKIGAQTTTLDARGALFSDGSLQSLYDALGQVRQLQSGTNLRTYKRDALGRVVTETDQAGKTTRYAWDGSTRIVRLRSDGTTSDVTVDGADLDEHLVTITGSNRQFLHQDRRGSVYLVSDTAGVPKEWTSYTAYGEPTLRNLAGTTISNTAVNGQFGFNGLPQDFVLGVVDMRARTYRPVLGRFLSPDPLGLIDGTNRFAFAGASPLSFLDPFGLDHAAAYRTVASFMFTSIPSTYDYSYLADVSTEAALKLLQGVNNMYEGGPCNTGVGRCWMDTWATRGRAIGKLGTAAVGFTVGAVLCGSGIGSVIGCPLQAESADYGGSAFTEIATGDPQQTFTGQVLGPTAQHFQESLVTGAAMAAPFLNPFQSAVLGRAARADVSTAPPDATPAVVAPPATASSNDVAPVGRRMSGVPDGNFVPNSSITERYQRPTGAGPTAAQRASVQGKPCVDCSDITPRQVADHIVPLSVEYYRTGAIDISFQSSLAAVQPHCPACSAIQGGQLSAFSRRMRGLLGL